MRALFVILIFVAAACGDDPEPTYTSIAGKWEFTSTRVSGKFEIFQDGGRYYVNNNEGTFKIDGNEFPISDKSEVAKSDFKINNLSLNDGNDRYISFYYANGDIDSKYRTITFSKCTIQVGLNGENISFPDNLIVSRSN